jgi:hypothetical protein
VILKDLAAVADGAVGAIEDAESSLRSPRSVGTTILGRMVVLRIYVIRKRLGEGVDG